MKILVVDDSRAMRLIMRRTLREAGFGDHEVIEATNGSEALKTIEEKRPDLVLSDWNMPEMTGIQLLEAIRDKGIDVKIGLVTSEGTTEMRERALAAGASFLIVKPFTSAVFEEILGPILSRS